MYETWTVDWSTFQKRHCSGWTKVYGTCVGTNKEEEAAVLAGIEVLVCDSLWEILIITTDAHAFAHVQLIVDTWAHRHGDWQGLVGAVEVRLKKAQLGS